MSRARDSAARMRAWAEEEKGEEQAEIIATAQVLERMGTPSLGELRKRRAMFKAWQEATQGILERDNLMGDSFS